MDEFDRELLTNHPAWQQVLQMYLDLTTEPVERPEEQTGPRWAERIPSLEDFDPSELSAIHGQLIAWGWLKFQFEAEQTGLMYRVTSEGRMLLNRIQGKGPVSSQDAPADPDSDLSRSPSIAEEIAA